MFHFNTIARVSYYDHNQKADGYDHCYDCTAEALVLKEYLSRIHGLLEPDLLTEAVDYLAETLSKTSGSSRKTLRIDMDFLKSGSGNNDRQWDRSSSHRRRDDYNRGSEE